MSHTEDKKEYEISYITRTENGKETVNSFVQRFEGTIVSAEEPKRISLAYPIKKEQFGFFGVMLALLAPESIKELQKELLLEPEILRILFINEPIKIVRRERDMREGDMTEPPKPAKEDRAVTNEELEKKLQEILN